MVGKRRRKGPRGVCEFEGCGRFFCDKPDLAVGLSEASAETRARIGREPSHEPSPRGGARLEAASMAITTICPRWQTGQARRDCPVSFS